MIELMIAISLWCGGSVATNMIDANAINSKLNKCKIELLKCVGEDKYTHALDRKLEICIINRYYK